MKLIDWIIRLYPQAWRERYEDEMRAVLEEHDFTFLTAFDLLLGMVDARLDPYYRRAGSPFMRVSAIMLLYIVALVFVWLDVWEVSLLKGDSDTTSTFGSVLNGMIVSDSLYVLKAILEIVAIVVLSTYGWRMMHKLGWRRALFFTACCLLPVLGIPIGTTAYFDLHYPYTIAQYRVEIKEFVAAAVITGALVGNVVVAFVKLRSLRVARKVGQFRFLLGTEIVFVAVTLLMTLYCYTSMLSIFPVQYVLDVLLNMLTPFNLLAILCFFVATERWSKRATTIVCACVVLLAITFLVSAGLAQMHALDFMMQIQDFAEFIGVMSVVVILTGAAVVTVYQSLRRRGKTAAIGQVKEYEEQLPFMEMGGSREGEYR